MIKKIKIIGDVYDKDNNNMAGQVVDALITKGDGCETATFNNGHDYPAAFTHYNNQDQIAYFEIVGDIAESKQDDQLVKLQSYLQAEIRPGDIGRHYGDVALDLIKELKNDLSSANDELSQMSEVKPIEREHFDGGYVIIPTKFLDKELADEFKNNEDCIITPKEIVAMCASAQLEINKGDVRPSSLNVKLYTAINDFAQDELDTMIEAGKSN